MKKIFYLSLALVVVLAEPNGYYHQEYNYKSSASSYKNNELQHQKNDASFYAKDGDLEGRVKPKVDAHDEHSEYINPVLKNNLYRAANPYSEPSSYNSGYGSGLGQYKAQSDRLFGGGFNSGTGTYQGSSNYGSSNYGSSNYGMSSDRLQSANYGTYGSNLNAITERLQNEIADDLQKAVYNRYAGYSTSISSSQMSADIKMLEDQLKSNLTRKLQDALHYQYGTGHPQSTGGNYYASPNLNNQEVITATKNLEVNLIKQLHDNVRNTYNQQQYITPGYERLYSPFPSSIGYQYPSSRYTASQSSESITSIASRVQNDINSNLNHVLNQIQARYGSGNTYYSDYDIDREVKRIQNEIIQNITLRLDNEIRSNFGQQTLRGDSYYTVLGDGSYSPQSNYNSRDLENLKKQMQDNLLQKFNQSVQTYKSHYSGSNSYSYGGSTLGYAYSPSSVVGYTYSPNTLDLDQNSDYIQLQRQLQNQLSQQLQAALTQHKYQHSSGYSSSSYQPQTYQTSLNALSQELQRNLTNQLQHYSQPQYGYNLSNSGTQYEALKNQIQNNLMNELQQGLKQQYQYSASYSASSSSSSSSNYASGGGYGSGGTHQNYRSYDPAGPCCM